MATPRTATSPSLSPAASPAAPQRASFTVFDRGACSRPWWDHRPLSTPLVIASQTAFERFWSASHPRPQTTCDRGAIKAKPPRLDFRREMLVVFRGAPGSGEIDLISLVDRGYDLEAVYSNPLDPEAAGFPDRIPFEAILLRSTAQPIQTSESEVSQEMNRFYGHIPTLYRTADGAGRDLTPQNLERSQVALRREGRALLSQIWRLQSESSEGPQLAYTWLLEAKVWDVTMNDNERARTRYAEVVEHFPDSGAARIARFHVSQLVRRAMEANVVRRLNGIRLHLLANGETGRGWGRGWLLLGGEYEYLTTPRPDSLFTAVRCYEEGARDAGDPDTVQNCLLRAADICRTYLNRRRAADLYAECVRRYPDARSVPTSLQRIHDMYRQLADPRAGSVYDDFLRRYPRSACCAQVSRLR